MRKEITADALYKMTDNIVKLAPNTRPEPASWADIADTTFDIEWTDDNDAAGEIEECIDTLADSEIEINMIVSHGYDYFGAYVDMDKYQETFVASFYHEWKDSDIGTADEDSPCPWGMPWLAGGDIEYIKTGDPKEDGNIWFNENRKEIERLIEEDRCA